MKNHAVVAGTFLLFMSQMVFLSGCHDKSNLDTAQKPQVATLTLTSRDLPVSMEYIAHTASSKMVNIQSRVSGFLVSRNYREGSPVKKGQTLFQIDPRPFKYQLDEANAVLKASQATYATARETFNRISPLVKLNALPQKALDDARGKLRESEASVHQARAQRDTARLNLSYATIVSPVDGMANRAKVSEGSFISAENNLLTTVYQMSPMWVNFSISENELLKMARQTREGKLRMPSGNRHDVEIILEDGSVFPKKGSIVFDSPAYDTDTGSNLFRASVENASQTLKPGQYVRVRLKGAVRPNAIAVPETAVLNGSHGPYVWVIDGTRAKYRPIRAEPLSDGTLWVTEGLAPGEKIATDNLSRLENNLEVTETGTPDPGEVHPEADKSKKTN